jgi:hypothetical protein
MAENNAVMGIYSTHTEAEAAVKELQQSEFDMQKLSIVGKDYDTEEHVIGYYNANDHRMKVWGKLGAFWGGFWGPLFGSTFFVLPGIGPVMGFGPLVSWIVGGAGGGRGGGRAECAGRRAVQRGHPRRQYHGVRDGAQGCPVPRDRARSIDKVLT